MADIKTYSTVVDLSKKLGKIKPMHAAGAGPKQGYTVAWDVSHYFREMNIPYSRLHDIEYPFGSDQFVDIHCIFPDFDADENDPESYYFTSTDMYLQAMMDVGCEPFYRLGESIDHSPKKMHIHPPKDFAKWARICEHIIRHYNEGWADGFHFGIKYWEIWNEPDSYMEGYNKVNMWTGTKEQYFELYRVSANHLKSCFGDSIKIGGYSCCNLNALTDEVESPRGKHLLDWASDFLDYISAEETKAPLDFFSYHDYFNDPKFPYVYNHKVREWVNSKGFEDAEIIFTEWNIGYHQTIGELNDSTHAADVAYVFLSGQKTPVDMMMYYFLSKTTRFNRVFGPAKEIYSAYYSFVMFGKLYELGTEVDSGEYDAESDIITVAAANGKRAGVMLAKVTPMAEKLDITFKGIDGYTSYKVHLLDKEMSPTKPTVVKTGLLADGLNMSLSGRNCIMYIEIE